MRPNRQLRRLRGKTDTVDAEAAARAALGGQVTAHPKKSDGPVECIRMLRVARRSAVKARTQAANQLGSLVVTAPEPVRHQLRGPTYPSTDQSMRRPSVLAHQKPLPHMRSVLWGTWPADIKPSMRRSASSTQKSAVSAHEPTRPY